MTMGRALLRLAGGAIVALASIAAASDARADNGNQLTAAEIAKALGVQHPTSFFIQTDNINGNTSYQVPANQRLIIEFIGTSCILTNDASLNAFALVVLKNGTETEVALSVTPVSTTNSTDVTFGQMVRIYIDPGTTLQLNPIGRTGNPAAQLGCGSTVFGQLIDVP
jgi:hypothetical protein